MKNPDQLFDDYGMCHQHPLNKLIHWFCVPAIVLSGVAMLSVIPFVTINSRKVNV